MKVAKWGNSLAIRLPRAVVEIMDLKEGDDVKVGVAGGQALSIEGKPDRLALLERLRRYEGRMPKDFHFDRLEANEID
jgi:antitoxin MazE